MRVLMISKAYVVGIYQRKLELMAQQRGVDLTLVVPPSWKDRSGELRLERAYLDGYTMRVEPIRFNGSYHLHYYPTLPQILRDVQPDIIHIDEEPYNFCTWHILWWAQRIVPKAKTVFFSWQNIARQYPFPFSTGEAWTLRHVNAAIMGTQSAADVWCAKGYRGKFKVIPQFGIDPDAFKPTDRVPNPEPVVGYIGRLVPEKGVDLLLRALAKLHKQWRLYLVGQGPERESLERLASDLRIRERVWFAGQRPSTQMATMYPQLDVLVIPSRTRPTWKEQFGRVIVEAMACGVPVIGSDSAAIPDVIGQAGLVFPEDDVDLLTEALDRLLSSPTVRADLAARGRRHVLENYTQSRIASLTVDMYRELL